MCWNCWWRHLHSRHTHTKKDLHVHLLVHNRTTVAHITKMRGTKSNILVHLIAMGVLFGEGNHSYRKSYSMKRGYSCRQRIQTVFGQQKLEAGSSFFQESETNHGISSASSFYRLTKRSTRSVCELEAGSDNSINRCLSDVMNGLI